MKLIHLNQNFRNKRLTSLITKDNNKNFKNTTGKNNMRRNDLDVSNKDLLGVSMTQDKIDTLSMQKDEFQNNKVNFSV